MKTKRQIKMWLMLTLTVLVSVFSVLSDLLKFGASTQIFTVWYWLNLLLTNAAAVLIIFLSNSARKDIQMQKNEKFTTLSTTLFGLFGDLNRLNLRTSFESYIINDNARAKKEEYLAYLHKKITCCEEKIDKLENRFNMWRLWFRKEVIECPNTLRLIFWRGRLDFWQKRLANVDRDVKYAKVRYLRITYQSIFGTSEARLRESRDMSFHTAEHNLGILIKKVLLIFVFGFAASLGFGFEVVEWSLYFVYKLAIRLFQVGMALYTGISDADKFVGGDMCDALTNRISYVQSFKETLPNRQ